MNRCGRRSARLAVPPARDPVVRDLRVREAVRIDPSVRIVVHVREEPKAPGRLDGVRVDVASDARIVVPVPVVVEPRLGVGVLAGVSKGAKLRGLRRRSSPGVTLSARDDRPIGSEDQIGKAVRSRDEGAPSFRHSAPLDARREDFDLVVAKAVGVHLACARRFRDDDLVHDVIAVPDEARRLLEASVSSEGPLRDAAREAIVDELRPSPVGGDDRVQEPFAVPRVGPASLVPVVPDRRLLDQAGAFVVDVRGAVHLLEAPAGPVGPRLASWIQVADVVITILFEGNLSSETSRELPRGVVLVLDDPILVIGFHPQHTSRAVVVSTLGEQMRRSADPLGLGLHRLQPEDAPGAQLATEVVAVLDANTSRNLARDPATDGIVSKLEDGTVVEDEASSPSDDVPLDAATVSEIRLDEHTSPQGVVMAPYPVPLACHEDGLLDEVAARVIRPVRLRVRVPCQDSPPRGVVSVLLGRAVRELERDQSTGRVVAPNGFRPIRPLVLYESAVKISPQVVASTVQRILIDDEPRRISHEPMTFAALVGEGHDLPLSVVALSNDPTIREPSVCEQADATP